MWPPTVSLLGEPVLALVVLALVGAIAGVINTMAGGGSFLLLPLLMAMGVPAPVANGTTRFGVLVQSLGSVATFARDGHRPWKLVLQLAGPMCVGAAAGAWLATQLSAELFRPIVGATFLVWAVILIVRPGKLAGESSNDDPLAPGPVGYVAGGLIGVYGGFLQAGVGFPLLALLVGGLRLPPVAANSVKVALVLAYTCLALPVFAWAGQVLWLEASVLAAGSLLGAWAGTRWQLRSGAGVVRWFVVVMVALSGAFMLYESLR